MSKGFSIGQRLWGILFFFLIVMGFSIGATYLSLVKMSRYLDSSETEILRHTIALRSSLNEIEQELNDAAAQRDLRHMDEARRAAREFDGHLSILLTLDTGETDSYAGLQQEFYEYFSAAVAADEAAVREGVFSPAIQKHVERVNTLLPKLHTSIDRSIDRRYAIFDKMMSESRKGASAIITREIFFLGALALLGFLIVVNIIRDIIHPVKRLVSATKEIGAGNLDVRTEVQSEDELGRLGVSFNNMAEKLKEDRTALEELLSERDRMQRAIVKSNESLKEANILLQKADSAKSRFLASMSHELRTPLNAMINFTALVMEDWDDLRKDEEWFLEAKGMLERVKNSSYHLLDMINDLLDLAKIEAGKMPLDLDNADLGEIVRESVHSIESLAKKKNLLIVTEAKNGHYPALCDGRKVKQILLNLLGNAIKFTETGHVKVSLTRRDAEGYLIEVEDTGVGIPPEYHKVVFNRFEQVDGSDSRVHPGTGLGLNLVKEMAEMHGGTVSLKSEPEKGSTISVYLPKEAKPRPVR